MSQYNSWVSDGSLDVVHLRSKSGLYLNLKRWLLSDFNKLGLIIMPALPSEPGSALGLL